MEERKADSLDGEGERGSGARGTLQRLRERLRRWLRRPAQPRQESLVEKVQPAEGDLPPLPDWVGRRSSDGGLLFPEEDRSPGVPLTTRELAAVKTVYLHRLQQTFRSLHVYGLDKRRRATQEAGQALDLLAVYTPLNTTVEVPLAESDSEPGGTHVRHDRLVETRPLTLWEAVGRVRKAIVRGPHGAGKSTFLRYLALCLVECTSEGDLPGRTGLGAAWEHGAPFPVLIDLGGFATSSHNDGTASGLSAYIAAELGIDVYQLWYQIVLPGDVLFLLDGLEKASRATVGLVGHLLDTPNLFCISSHTYVDLDAESLRPLRELARITLAPWTTEQMDLYAKRWYAELGRQQWIDDETARDLPGQLCSMLRRPEVAVLAQSPSLMAAIALLNTVRGPLPLNRVMFYQMLVEQALRTWAEGRAGDERDLRQVFDEEGLRETVSQVTYEGYECLQRPGDLVEMSESDLRTRLINISRTGRQEAVDELVWRIRARPGILDESRPGVFTYVHPSLQAYSAARHLAAQPELPRVIVDLAQEDLALWHDVILFAIARLARIEHNVAAALELTDALCGARPPAEEPAAVSTERWCMAWLAGEALVEAGPELQGPGLQGTLSDVKRWLVALLERGKLEPDERARAGGVLARLPKGDPRPGVASAEPLWCEVPAGSFWQGEDGTARLAEAQSFWIARYPVTNEQYGAFLEATGHTAPTVWQGRRPPAGTGNQPVVYVTWEDALAYCGWLAKQVRGEQMRVWRAGAVDLGQPIPRSWTVRLPTSAEWEKAARGGLLIPQPSGRDLIDNPHPRRVYPWGDSWRLSTAQSRGDETRCNVSESEIGTTTPVGMYPSGVSPYGLDDMAGNVWEWCMDWADKDERYKVRRGGAFRYTHEQARCSAYDRAHPSLAWPYQGFRIVLGPPVSESTVSEDQR